MPSSARARAPRAPRHIPALLAAVAATAAACGGGRDTPTDPPAPVAPTRFEATTPVTGAWGTVARASYRDTLLDFEQAAFYWNDRVDWAAQRAQIAPRQTAATTFGALWNGATASIDPWLRRAGDRHSAYFPPSDAPGVVDSPDNAAYRVSGAALTAPGAPPLAYLYFPTFAGRNGNGRADSTQAVIRALDAGGPCGWVLDLRFNPGGAVFAMLAGLNPLLGDAPATATAPGLGGLVDRFNARYLLFVSGGAAGFFDPATNQSQRGNVVSSNYTLRRPGSPVALLIGPTTASAGELITLGFRGGPVPNRSFGDSTYGVTTTPAGTYLRPDSGFLNITAGIMFDRTGRLYGGAVLPDEPVSGGPDFRTLVFGLFGPSLNAAAPAPSATDPVLNAATAWLRAQPACSPVLAERRPAERAPSVAAPARLPGVVRTGGVGLDRLSPYFLPGGRLPRVLPR